MSKLDKSIVWAYAFYGFASTLMTSMAMSYTNIFLTDYLMYSAALMGTTLLIGRIVDLIVSIICGGIIETARLPWGKYRSWVMICRFTVFAGTTLLFTNTSALPTGVKMAITITAYILLHCSMDFLQTAQFGILAVVAGPDMEARTTLSIRNSQAVAVSGIIAAATTIPLINFFTPIVGGANAYTVVAVLFGLFYLIGATVLVRVTAPYDVPQPKDVASQVPTPTIKDMVESVFTNDQLLVYMSATTLTNIAMMLSSGVMAYYFAYVLDNFLLMSVAMTATTTFSVVASVIGPKIGVKLGRKNAMVAGTLMTAAGFFAMTFLAKESVVVYIVLACFNALGRYFFMGFGPNYVIDAGEYGLYRTGKDTRAVAMSMMAVPMKIGFMIGGTLAGYGLEYIGYTAGMTVTREFVDKFMWLFTGIPAIIYVIGALVFLIGYKITDEDAAMYAKANAERMAKLAEGNVKE